MPLLVDQILTHNVEVEAASAGAGATEERGGDRRRDMAQNEKKYLPLKGMAIGAHCDDCLLTVEMCGKVVT